jgi:hypothetical protein
MRHLLSKLGVKDRTAVLTTLVEGSFTSTD